MRIHPSADVSDRATIGKGTLVWHAVQIREEARVGEGCIIGQGVYVDRGVRIGNRVKIQNYACIYQGVVVEDWAFIGPHACFTNDLSPRATTPEGELLGTDAWTISPTTVRKGASIGANATIRCGIELGAWSMVGAGSVVTKDVEAHALVVGNPALPIGYVCRCGLRCSSKPDRPCVDCVARGLSW